MKKSYQKMNAELVWAKNVLHAATTLPYGFEPDEYTITLIKDMTLKVTDAMDEIIYYREHPYDR